MDGPSWWADESALTLAEAVLRCTGAVAVWALALYVITRGGLRRIPVLTWAAMTSLVVYLLGGGIGAFTADSAVRVAWQRATWVGPALLPGLWLALTSALAFEEGPEPLRPARWRLFRATLAVAVSLGVLFTAAGATDLVRDWNTNPTSDTPAGDSAPGPLYPLYAVYVVGCASWAAWNLAALWRDRNSGAPRPEWLRWLLAGAALFFVGGLHLTYAAGPAAAIGLPGFALLIAGIAAMGWSISRYGALLAGEVLTGDVRAYAASLTAIVTLYAAALLLAGQWDSVWLTRTLLLLLLVITTHVLAARGGPLLERLLFGATAGGLRSQLRALADRVPRQPDSLAALAEASETVAGLVRDATAPGLAPARAPDTGAANGRPEPAGGEVPPDSFRVLVEGALRHLNDLPGLSEHPLLQHLPATAVGGLTILERGSHLRAILGLMIDQLKPAGPRPSPGPSVGPGPWLHYLVLHEAYMEGRPNKQIMQRYHLSEGSFHRARRRAVDAVAVALFQQQAPAMPVGHLSAAQV